ncbi:hypothetical protein M426DRAFT_320736 [Hypoxylon sp. CI-4A]|nr:hypothetical protein M426DRAFT_320736 [Hypoxylon sp. CI-4A]
MESLPAMSPTFLTLPLFLFLFYYVNILIVCLSSGSYLISRMVSHVLGVQSQQ